MHSWEHWSNTVLDLWHAEMLNVATVRRVMFAPQRSGVLPLQHGCRKNLDNKRRSKVLRTPRSLGDNRYAQHLRATELMHMEQLLSLASSTEFGSVVWRGELWLQTGLTRVTS